MPCIHDAQRRPVEMSPRETYSEAVVEVVVVGLRTILGVGRVWMDTSLPVDVHEATRKR